MEHHGAGKFFWFVFLVLIIAIALLLLIGQPMVEFFHQFSIVLE